METWVFYGLAAALLSGASGILLKIAGGSGSYNLSASTIAILVLVGVAAIFIPYYLFDNKFSVPIPTDREAILIAVSAGILWALGSVFFYMAFNIGADASKLIPLSNTSALFAVVFGIVLLHENPSHGETWKAVIGASLIVLGASFLV